ncbi:hypothetical protein [Pedobacter sp. Leaf170]|uniref:hypothetical protein n=1 Tax=Pedobacter sp. Leaf170 TaxID=2876558 RepID=UPI001E4255BC|nr:hypothetical protein [Pedobacter sp. Leaf170]
MKTLVNITVVTKHSFTIINPFSNLKKINLTIIFVFLSLICQAQGYFVPTNNQLGCRDKNLNGYFNVNNQRIYLQTYAGTIFNASSGVSYSDWNLDEPRPLNRCFSFVVTSVNGCTIRKIVAGVTTNASGDYGYFTNTIKCPLDNYIPFLIIPVGILCFIYIWRKKLT